MVAIVDLFLRRVHCVYAICLAIYLGCYSDLTSLPDVYDPFFGIVAIVVAVTL